MNRRQPRNNTKAKWPEIWLMTDPRFGVDLLPAIRGLPFGSGIVFRHYQLEPGERLRLFRKVRRICRQRGHRLVLAGPEQDALRWQADGFHFRAGRSRSKLMRSAPVHNRRELCEASRNAVDLIFLSPLFPTASHPTGKALGRLAFNALAKQSGAELVIALGGMTSQRARTLNRRLIHGWAAIDAFRKKSV
jgi:thiamine-phosphate pyrophosphorylase